MISTGAVRPLVRRAKSLTLLAVVPFLLLAGCAGGVDDGTIYIGLAGPAEKSYGISQRQAAQMAVDEINRAGGIDGRRLELVMKDDAADSERAIEVAAELRDDPRVVAVVGHINSNATLAAAQVYNDEKDGLVQVSPSSTSPEVTQAGSWTFRVCPSDLQHGPALAAWAREHLGHSRAGVVYHNDAYGRGLMDGFAAAFEGEGGTVVALDPYLPSLMDSDAAWEPYLRRAIGADMGALMIAGDLEHALSIIRTARRLGYDGPVLGADGLLGIEENGGIAEGTFISTAFLADRPTPEARAFVRAYEQRFGNPADADGALTYDAVYVIAEALKQVGPDRRAIRDYIAGMGTDHPAYKGVTGTIAFDENGDVPGKEVDVGVVRDRRVVTARS